MTRNASGEVYSVPVDSVLKAIDLQRSSSRSFKVNGVKKVKVGGGARTLKASPDGEYLYIACNSGSALYIVDAKKMSVVGKLPVDSYPVGLDVSEDGKFVAVTSQGRNRQGGNAVNIFEVVNLKSLEKSELILLLDEKDDGLYEAEPKLMLTKEVRKSEERSTAVILYSLLFLVIVLTVFIAIKKLRKYAY